MTQAHNAEHPDLHHASKAELRLARWQTRFFTAWAAIGTIVLLSAALWGLSRISAALLPFLLAFLFVFLLRAPVAWLVGRGMTRSIAVVACYAGALVVLTVAGIFIFPSVGRQIAAFAEDAPAYIDQIQTFVEDMQQTFSDIVVPVWLSQSVRSIASSLTDIVVGLGDALAQGLLAAGSGLATFVFDAFIALVLAYWILKDLPKMRDEITVLAGRKYEDDVENLLDTLVRVVGGYLRGQTIASLVTGFIATVGLAIIGVPYALVLGIITFIFNYIPYIGPWIAGLIAALVALIVSPLTAVLAIGVVILAQQLTDNLVTPRVMSEQVDLHPTLVIFSLLVGGTLFGILGMIMSIPVAATGKGLFVYYFERKTRRSLTTEDGALFRSPGSDEDEDDDGENDDSSGRDIVLPADAMPAATTPEGGHPQPVKHQE